VNSASTEQSALCYSFNLLPSVATCTYEGEAELNQLFFAYGQVDMTVPLPG
jgi:hypothetical protein